MERSQFGRGPPPPGPPPFPPGMNPFSVPPLQHFYRFESPGSAPNYPGHNFTHSASYRSDSHQSSNYRPGHFNHYGYPPDHRTPLPRDTDEYLDAPNTGAGQPDTVVENNGNINIPPPSVDKPNREPWLHDWLEERVGRDKQQQQETPLSIPEAKKLIKTAICLLEELRTIKGELDCGFDGNNEDWAKKEAAAQELQDKLSSIRKRVDEKELGYKIRRAQLKRARLKRQRKKQYEQRGKDLERRKELHEKIDQWQASLLAEAIDKKREKELKAAADATLSEVRKKINEARKCREILERLTKLRQVRKDAMERMGLYTAEDTDMNFVKRRDQLGVVMEQQLKTYESEETTLKVMLEAEAEESKEKLKEETSARNEKQLNRHRIRLRRLLFGLHEVPSHTNPIYPFWEYHTAAESNLQTFLTVRQQWDSCIVPPGSPGGSGVPPGWVVPSTPCDTVWRTALKHSGE